MGFIEQNEAVGQIINSISQSLGLPSSLILIMLVGVLVWSVFWKLKGMWISARKGSWIWFIVFALTNTVGILPILYIKIFSKTDWNKYIKLEVKKPNLKKKFLKAKSKVKKKKR